MSKRYWIAAFGNCLGCVAALIALVFAVTDTVPLALRIVACMFLFFFGWGTHRFESIMKEEYDARYHRELR